MENSSLWWAEPPWLKNIKLWPLEEEETLLYKDSDCAEVRITVTQVMDDLDDLLKWDGFRSFKKFVLTMAWMLRFIDNVTKPVSQRKLQDISILELEKATSHVLRLLRRSTYAKEYESLEKGDKKKCHLINQLNLFLDKGLICCKG